MPEACRGSAHHYQVYRLCRSGPADRIESTASPKTSANEFDVTPQCFTWNLAHRLRDHADNSLDKPDQLAFTLLGTRFVRTGCKCEFATGVQPNIAAALNQANAPIIRYAPFVARLYGDFVAIALDEKLSE